MWFHAILNCNTHCVILLQSNQNTEALKEWTNNNDVMILLCCRGRICSQKALKCSPYRTHQARISRILRSPLADHIDMQDHFIRLQKETVPAPHRGHARNCQEQKVKERAQATENKVRLCIHLSVSVPKIVFLDDMHMYMDLVFHWLEIQANLA